jgi:hypothetical protein
MGLQGTNVIQSQRKGSEEKANPPARPFDVIPVGYLK